MFKADFKQTLAEIWLLNGNLSPGELNSETLESDGWALDDDVTDDKVEDGDNEDEDEYEVSAVVGLGRLNRLLHPQLDGLLGS